MATRQADIKKQLENIAGHEIETDVAQLRWIWYPVAAYDYSDGLVSEQNVFFPAKRCNNARLLDVSGASYTGSDGKRVFRLSSFICLPEYRLLNEPVNLLVTARSSNPFLLTATHTLISPGDIRQSDVEITVHGWDTNGTAAPGLPFHWRCRVHAPGIIL